MADLNTDEPVLVRSAVQSVVSATLGILVTHGVIPGAQASADTQTLVPLVLAALPLIFGAWARTKVRPEAKVAALTEAHDALTAKDGLLTDADTALIRQSIADVIDSRLVTETPQPAQAVAATEADVTPAVSVPDGMAAGATPPAPVAAAQ